MRAALRRILLFVGMASILPALAAVAAAARVARPQFYLIRAIARYDLHSTLSGFLRALLVSCAWSSALGLASLWAFPPGRRASALRAVRVIAAMWIVAVVLYPGFASLLPPLTYLPWGLGIACLIAVWLLSCVPRSTRPRHPEMVLIAVSLAAFFWNPSTAAADLRSVAGRGFTDRDVLLLGFDSISAQDTSAILRDFSPSSGTKVVFSNASTTIALTGGAWRSVLSGRVPAQGDLLPGSIWPREAGSWLPGLLQRRGYRPTFLQDDPTTNVYRPEEALRVTEPQGWRSALTEFAWDVMFPLSTAGGRWWVGAFGGPAMEPGEYAYCARCFLRSVLTSMAEDARGGPVFWAVHTCYAHEPVPLSLDEVERLPGWWKRTPRQLRGLGQQVGDSSGRNEVTLARVDSVKDLLRETLQYLDRSGVLGHATVIVLSDHGPRGDAVPQDLTRNVMLTAFLPGDRRDVFVQEPVSLIDVAPTLAARLAIEMPLADGVPLPIDGKRREARRTSIFSHSSPFEGFDTWRLSAESVERLISFGEDGTFSIDPKAFAANLLSMRPGIVRRGR